MNPRGLPLCKKGKERKQKVKCRKVQVALEPVFQIAQVGFQEQLCFSFLTGHLYSRPCAQLPGSSLVYMV